jgi:hypothetical protein
MGREFSGKGLISAQGLKLTVKKLSAIQSGVSGRIFRGR